MYAAGGYVYGAPPMGGPVVLVRDEQLQELSWLLDNVSFAGGQPGARLRAARQREQERQQAEKARKERARRAREGEEAEEEKDEDGSGTREQYGFVTLHSGPNLSKTWNGLSSSSQFPKTWEEMKGDSEWSRRLSYNRPVGGFITVQVSSDGPEIKVQGRNGQERLDYIWKLIGASRK